MFIGFYVYRIKCDVPGLFMFFDGIGKNCAEKSFGNQSSCQNFGAGLGLNHCPVQIFGSCLTLVLIWHRFIAVCLTQFWPIVASEYQVSDHSFVGQVSPSCTCTSGKSLI